MQKITQALRWKFIKGNRRHDKISTCDLNSKGLRSDMVWTMADAEKDRPMEAIVIDSGRLNESPKKSSTKKYIIIGVSCVVLAVLVLIGILVGLYLFTDAFHKIASQSMQTKPGTYQEVNADVTENVVEYRVSDKNLDATYIDDYNSYLEVVKLVTSSESICYVAPMNETQKVDLTQVQNPFDADASKSSKSLFFVRNKMPIPDISFLNKKSRSLCKGLSTYWVTPACPSHLGTGNGSKTKRRDCGNTCNNICKAIRKLWECRDYCWAADAGCFLWDFFG